MTAIVLKFSQILAESFETKIMFCCKTFLVDLQITSINYWRIMNEQGLPSIWNIFLIGYNKTRLASNQIRKSSLIRSAHSTMKTVSNKSGANLFEHCVTTSCVCGKNPAQVWERPVLCSEMVAHSSIVLHRPT